MEQGDRSTLELLRRLFPFPPALTAARHYAAADVNQHLALVNWAISRSWLLLREIRPETGQPVLLAGHVYDPERDGPLVRLSLTRSGLREVEHWARRAAAPRGGGG